VSVDFFFQLGWKIVAKTPSHSPFELASLLTCFAFYLTFSSSLSFPHLSFCFSFRLSLCSTDL
jgi:hypothetical protein